MNKSFTLIEILVVIVIIGIISAFIIVSMAGVSSKANIAKSQAFANSLRNSLLLNLVSEWKLNGDVADAWGINSGVWHGSGGGEYTAASWRTGSECVSGGCLAFDGTDDDISTGYSGLASVQGTVEFWVKFTEDKGQGLFHFFESGLPTSDYIRSYISPGRSIDLLIEDGNVSMLNVSYVFNHGNQWNHIVWLQDGQSVKLYVNGQIRTLGGTNNGSWWSGHLTLGYACFGNAWGYLHGFMDDIRVYNQALPTSAIQEEYYSGLMALFKNNGIALSEFNQRVAELKYTLTNNE
ncbi:MAG: LamG domain-containing protein [Candidatus Pacebacteria bacterium]|nr:LamG domain-containing protein [Candidatus Paceibacterota bacterium]